MARKPSTNPRKLASQERSLLTVDALLEATARVLMKEGYDRASTNKIAAVAGVSIGSLYQYFPSKEALVAAVIDRHVHEMFQVVRDALVKVAAYYASLDLARAGAANDAQAVASEPDPAQTGKAAAASCVGCHGEAGISKTPGMPNLVGLDPKYLVAAMAAYKNGQRKNEVMKSMLGPIRDADLNDIALYYALQSPARAQTPASGNQAAGRAAAAACAGCHGAQGVSTNPAIPSLAGQDARYLAAAIRGYKDGSRDDATMKGLVASLDDGAINDLAAFYASQQPQAPNVRKPLTTAEWAQRCDRCHGVNGNSTDPRSPALAGQRLDYLSKVLHAYRTGVRKSPEMAAMSAVLSEDDVEKLAAYYARQMPRAFVYVIVPAR